MNYYVLLCFVAYFPITVKPECLKKPLKYIVNTLNNFTFDTEHRESYVISVGDEVLRIIINANVPKICKGSLNITGETLHFFAKNKGVKEIEPGAFENQGIIFKLELNNNSLTKISKGTFKNMPVKELNLSFNKIVTMEKGAIEDLPDLYLLRLNNNNIKQFYPGSLLNTPDMLILEMAFNKIEILEENHFLFMTKNKKVGINLSYNELIDVHPKAFDGINVYNINLTHNKLREEEETFYKINYVVFE